MPNITFTVISAIFARVTTYHSLSSVNVRLSVGVLVSFGRDIEQILYELSDDLLSFPTGSSQYSAFLFAFQLKRLL